MEQSNSKTNELTMRRRTRRTTAIALAAAVVLATAGLAAANHYPEVRKPVKRKDQGVLDGVRRLTYADSTYIDLAANTCDCLELTCDDGHFMTSCGGEIEPYDAGFLSAARRTSRETCYVCGCAAFDGVVLRATPVCMGF